VAARADALAKSLAKGSRGGTWLVSGAEEWLREEAVQRLIAAHLDTATRDFNLDQLQATSVDPETLASICQTPPMMAEWRVVVVRDAQVLAANARARSLVETIVSLKLPGLVLVLTGDTSDAQFWKNLRKSVNAVEYRPLAIGEVPDWLAERADASGVQLEPNAARALASAIGTELGVLAQELEKLIGFVGDRRRIRVGDVAAVVGHVPRVNRWEWFDTVSEARFAEARAALPALLDAESGIGLLIGLGSQLLRIGIALAGGEKAVLEVLPPRQQFLVKRIISQARRWTPVNVDAALDDLLRADRLLKSTSLDQRQVLDELMLRLEARRTAAAA
jgi:DNA polymerase-3 subunit delta